MSFLVFVTFKIKPASIDAFLPLMLKQAKTSKMAEHGCSIFEVWTNASQPNLILLYEVYDSADAFAVHLASAHFQQFDAETKLMIEQKEVVTCDRKLEA